MARVVCTLPNASDLIGGLDGLVRFSDQAGLWTSEELSPDQAAYFCRIRGYVLAAESPAPVVPTVLESGPAKSRKGKVT